MRFRLSLPAQLGIVIVSVLTVGAFVPKTVIELAYTFSVAFKELLGFSLPFILFTFVITGILSFKRNAPVVLMLMLSSIFCSNALVACTVYGIMHLLFGRGISGGAPTMSALVAPIEPLISIALPRLIRSEHALIAAIVLGLLAVVARSSAFETGMNRIKQIIEAFLNTIVLPLLPLYVLGFLLKLRYEGTFVTLAREYGSTFALIVAVQLTYLLLYYFVAGGFSLKRTTAAIRTALASYLTAFSTMSSTLTVPVSIRSAQINTGNSALAHMAMPIMANVHLLGDAISTPILAMTTMLLFQGTLPNFVQYARFVLYFCTAMFAVSGIPGGGILVMIPVLVSQLGFTPDMISIITTLYFLLDSFGTAANVMGDGALVIILDKLLKRFGISNA